MSYEYTARDTLILAQSKMEKKIEEAITEFQETGLRVLELEVGEIYRSKEESNRYYKLVKIKSKVLL